MNKPSADFVKFFKKEHILHLATASHNKPYCATCFYLYLEETNTFLFASNEDTRHIQEALSQNEVAFAIAHHTKILSKIQGVQALGKLSVVNNEELRQAYTKRFPVAVFLPFKLWRIKPYYIKMTVNRLGFAKKIIWEGEASATNIR